ncbi:ArsR/SmtB family transcription factor [Streptomyces violascens]|uniref:ArsR/SmtB family transcription factor n=1 Tax=Streptomyces violascens TaxID=67381 RepID=UPI001CFDBBCF|nr:winged helix-turn-helix domain-containing protein [Streptomyces violascens]
MVLSVSASDLSSCRFLVSPLLEVLAAAEVLCGQHPAPPGRARRGPTFGRRPALAFPQAEVQHRIRRTAGRLLRRQEVATGRQEADFSALGPLEEPAREFFQDCLADDWPRIRTALESDVALRAHNLAAFGVRHVVDNLPGLTVREGWDAPGHTGRGLILVPSVFQRTRVLLTNEWGTVITYPASGRGRLWEDSEAVAPTRLGALLGRGRAAALLNIGAGCGTTELADRLGVSAGTASVHVTALRNGGLVATHRVGKAVNHVLTPVGSALITAQLTMEPVKLPPMP